MPCLEGKWGSPVSPNGRYRRCAACPTRALASWAAGLPLAELFGYGRSGHPGYLSCQPGSSVEGGAVVCCISLNPGRQVIGSLIGSL